MIKLFNQINSILIKKDKINLYKIIFLKFFLGIFEVISVLTFVPFFYMVTDKNFVNNNKIVNEINSILNFSEAQLTIFFLALPLVTIIVLNFYRLLTSWIESKTINDLWLSFHSNLFYYYLSRPYLYYIENDSNFLLSKFISRANEALTGLMIPMYFLAGSILTSAVLMFMIFLFNPLVSTIAIIIIIIFYLSLFKILKRKVEKFSSFSPIFSKKTFSVVEESFKSIKSIIISGSQDFFHQQFERNAKIYANNSKTVQFYGLTPRSAIEIFAYSLIFAFTFFYIFFKGNNVTEIIVALGVYLITFQKLVPILNELFSKYYSILKNKHMFLFMMNDLAESEKLATQRRNINKIKSSFEFTDNIIFKNLNFSYTGKKNFSLDIDSLKILKGESIGITGKSGSGKTTFLNIITGLIQRNKFEIFFDNNKLNNEDILDYQKLIEYLPQNIFILNDSIKKNIAFGLEENQINFNKVREAAKLAEIDNFIENDCDDKYNTIVGENAIKLSGGQRQRIGIARSLYLDKEIIIFDEATNSLDEDTELRVIANILSKKNKTIIIVTHNKKLLNKLDRAIYFEDGKIVKKVS